VRAGNHGLILPAFPVTGLIMGLAVGLPRFGEGGPHRAAACALGHPPGPFGQ